MTAAERGSWIAADPAASLAAVRRVRDAPPPTATVAGMFYAESTTTIVGEPDAGKSMFLAAVTARIVMDGGTVLWIDYEQGERRVIERLLAFDLTDREIAARVHRVHSPVGLPDAEFFAVYAGVTLAAFDGFTGLLSAFGGSSNSDVDIENVYASVLRPLKATGAAVVTLDHVAKDKDGRGRWAIGSQRKIGAPDHAYIFDAGKKFQPDHGGRAVLRTSRDRAGGVDVIDFTLDADMSWRLECDRPVEFRPTVLMERVSRYLEAQTDSVSTRTIVDDVGGKAQYLRNAIAALIADGNVHAESGHGRSVQHTLITRYRESEDQSKPGASRCVLAESGRTGNPVRPTHPSLRSRGEGTDAPIPPNADGDSEAIDATLSGRTEPTPDEVLDESSATAAALADGEDPHAEGVSLSSIPHRVSPDPRSALADQIPLHGPQGESR